MRSGLMNLLLLCGPKNFRDFKITLFLRRLSPPPTAWRRDGSGAAGVGSGGGRATHAGAPRLWAPPRVAPPAAQCAPPHSALISTHAWGPLAPRAPDGAVREQQQRCVPVVRSAAYPTRRAQAPHRPAGRPAEACYYPVGGAATAYTSATASASAHRTAQGLHNVP